MGVGDFFSISTPGLNVVSREILYEYIYEGKCGIMLWFRDHSAKSRAAAEFLFRTANIQ